jgi:nucleoside-diphosphate-sugar epimerase
LLKSSEHNIYNICSGQPVRLWDLLLELAYLLGNNSQNFVELTTERPHEPLILVGENMRLKEMGWRPALTLVQGLEQMLHGESP